MINRIMRLLGYVPMSEHQELFSKYVRALGRIVSPEHSLRAENSIPIEDGDYSVRAVLSRYKVVGGDPDPREESI